MGGNRMMEKRGHQMCRMVNYDVRQKVTQEIVRKSGNKLVSTPGNVEVMIYKGKSKIEGGMKDIKKAAQKVYDLLKDSGKQTYVSKKVIKKYNLV
jgi:hypothetical protein|tara:strand:+ start:124 stop:408 length:285 start_codon:yes stop_codon:yes gene_type:complete